MASVYKPALVEVGLFLYIRLAVAGWGMAMLVMEGASRMAVSFVTVGSAFVFLGGSEKLFEHSYFRWIRTPLALLFIGSPSTSVSKSTNHLREIDRRLAKWAFGSVAPMISGVA